MSEPATNAGMNTLVAVAIAPCGTGDELSAEVAEVVRVIRESGLPNRTTSMFTEIDRHRVGDGAGHRIGGSNLLYGLDHILLKLFRINHCTCLLGIEKGRCA